MRLPSWCVHSSQQQPARDCHDRKQQTSDKKNTKNTKTGYPEGTYVVDALVAIVGFNIRRSPTVVFILCKAVLLNIPLPTADTPPTSPLCMLQRLS